MADIIQLELVTPTRVVAHAEVSEIVAPGASGEFGVLPGHASYISLLRPGEVRFNEGGQLRRFVVGRGFAEVGPNRAVLLTDSAEDASGLNSAEIQENIRRDEERMRGLSSSDAEYATLMDRLERNRARLASASRH